MLARYKSPGNVMDYTPGSAVAAGDVVVIGSIVAVANHEIAANALGTVAIEGVFEMPKAVLSTSALAQGTKVYWNAGSSIVTTTASTHKVAGYVHKAAGATDPTVAVKLARA